MLAHRHILRREQEVLKAGHELSAAQKVLAALLRVKLRSVYHPIVRHLGAFRRILLPQLFLGLLHSRHEMSALLRLIRTLQPKICDRTEGDESVDSAANNARTFSLEWRDTSSSLSRPRTQVAATG